MNLPLSRATSIPLVLGACRSNKERAHLPWSRDADSFRDFGLPSKPQRRPKTVRRDGQPPFKMFRANRFWRPPVGWVGMRVALPTDSNRATRDGRDHGRLLERASFRRPAFPGGEVSGSLQGRTPLFGPRRLTEYWVSLPALGSTGAGRVPYACRRNGTVDMHVLVIYSHPRTDSFSSALREAAIVGLKAAVHTVEVRDLYAEGFRPTMSGDERGGYYREPANLDGIEEHVAALRRADALVLIYPTWWFGMPAMLKGWFDRVWVPSVAFRLQEGGGLQPLLSNIRRIGVVTTYGSPLWLLWVVGWPDWRMVHHGFQALCARRCRLDWISLTGMDTCTAGQRERFVAKVQSRLSRWR